MTVTNKNFEIITEETFIKDIVNLGCRLFFYIGYVPVMEGTEELILNSEQESKIQLMINDFKSKFPAVFIAFPGGEKEMGGCLSSGRGFVHISPEGNLEPCPFAPYSDASLQNLTLKDALKSEFLKKIRENHNKLSESKGGCALWENRQWVQSLLKNSD